MNTWYSVVIAHWDVEVKWYLFVRWDIVMSRDISECDVEYSCNSAGLRKSSVSVAPVKLLGYSQCIQCT